jgi:NTE family protein
MRTLENIHLSLDASLANRWGDGERLQSACPQPAQPSWRFHRNPRMSQNGVSIGAPSSTISRQANSLKPMTFIERARAFMGLADRYPKWPPDRLSLALQGGGSFGAFTWGVLDRLLDEPNIGFDAISGASAGAVNAVLLAAGMADGGRQEARARLTQFWRRMSRAAALMPKPAAPPFGAGFELVLRSMSPYQFNPFNLNPLREALVEAVDFERLRSRSPVKLLIAVTRVRDGRLKIVTERNLTVDCVLASACLPLLHHAIEIDGEAYWDGGYAANPPLLPLIRASECEHVLIVQVTPNSSSQAPTTAREIAKRVEQIQFNATLNSELEALKYGKIIGATAKLRRLRIGRISAHEEFEGLGEQSAGDLGWDFLERLHASGMVAADLWLNQAMPGGAPHLDPFEPDQAAP